MRAGEIFADRFEIEELAGAGAMGAIHRAKDRVTGERVALKTMKPEAGAMADRFAREARILAELSHPAIVRYVAHGTADTGAPFLAMEWLEGEDLSHRLKRAGLNVAESVSARAAGRRRAHRGARTRRHPPGYQAGEHLPAGRRDVGAAKVLDFGTSHGSAKRRAARARASRSARRATCRPSRRAASATSTRAPTCSASVACSTSASPASRRRSSATTCWPCSRSSRVRGAAAPRSTCAPICRSALDELVARMLAKSPEARPDGAEAIVRALTAIAP